MMLLIDDLNSCCGSGNVKEHRTGEEFLEPIPMNRISEPIEIEPCSSGEKSMYFLKTVFLSLKKFEKNICMYAMETPVVMQNLKMKYIFL
jgi:hypothetical protein